MVDIQQCPLSALEQDFVSGLDGVPQQERRVRHVRPQQVRIAEILIDDLVGLHREGVVDPGKDLVLVLEGRFDLLAEDLLIEQVLDPDPDAGVLVGVGGSYPFPSSAYPVLPQVALNGGVELLVVGHDQVGVP